VEKGGVPFWEMWSETLVCDNKFATWLLSASAFLLRESVSAGWARRSMSVIA